MRAAVIHSHGSRDVLQIDEIDEPACNPNQVKVSMKSCSINHLDIWVRKGIPGISIPLPMILGSDGAGIVSEVGKNVKTIEVGDKVVIQPGTYSSECNMVKKGLENLSPTYGILGETETGVQSEYVTLNPENVYPMPNNLSFEEASSMQLVFMTAYQMLIKRANLKKNETVLIYGGASGIGTAAIQIAKDMGCHVIATVGSKDKFDHVFKFGSDYALNHSELNWHKVLKDILKGNQIDVIFEHVGVATWDISMRTLGRGGRIVTCGATTGYDVNIDLRHLFSKQQSILGSTMSDMDTFKKVQDKIQNGIYVPFVDKVYPLADIRHAHSQIENRKNIGKVVLSID